MPSPTLTLRHYTTPANATAGTGTDLDAASRQEFKAVRSDPGALITRLPNTDAALPGIGLGHYVQARLDGTPVFMGRVEGIDRDLRDRSEEAGQLTSLDCRGAIAEWAKAKVQPSTPVGAKLWSRDRLFGWMSAELDISGFAAAVQQWQQNTAAAGFGAKIGMPLGWFDPEGWWIWSEASGASPPLHDPGVSYFFRDLYLDAPTEVALHIAADDAFSCYVDGVPAAASNEVNGWQHPFRVRFNLGAGTHRIAVEVENYDRTASSNTAGLIAALYSLDTSGKEDTLLLRTDSDWVCVHDPLNPPGVTADTVLETLLAEGQASGELTHWTLVASGTFEADQQFSFPVGTSLLDALGQLSDSHIDYTVDPDAFVARVFPLGGAGSATSVATLTTLTSHKVKERDTAVDELLLLFSKGFTKVGEPGRQEFLSLGAARTQREARTVGAAELDRLADDLEGVEITPLPDSGAFTIYDVGDVITVPAVGGGTTTKRIRAIRVQDDGADGQLTVTPELEDRLDPVEIRTMRAVERMANGTVGGRSLAATVPSVSESVVTQRVELETDSFDWNATGDATLQALIDVEHNPMRFNADGRIAWIQYEWGEAPAVDATVVGKIDGVVMFTHTLAAGDTSEPRFPNLAINRTQAFTLTLTSVDAVGERLTAKVHQAVFV